MSIYSYIAHQAILEQLTTWNWGSFRKLLYIQNTSISSAKEQLLLSHQLIAVALHLCEVFVTRHGRRK